MPRLVWASSLALAMAKLKGPKNSAPSLSFGGIRYEADAAGVFEVPDEAVETLQRHGFKPVTEPEQKRKK